MDYTTLALFIDADWISTQPFGISPRGRTTGRAQTVDKRDRIVIWNEDGSVGDVIGPFDSVYTAAQNDVGDLVATVIPSSGDSARLVLIRGGIVVTDFSDAFGPGLVPSATAVNDSGLIVGYAYDPLAHVNRGFSLRLPDGLPVYLDIPGASSAGFAAVNESGTRLVNGTIAEVIHSFVVTPADEVRPLGPVILQAINSAGLAVGYDNQPAYQPGSVDTSSPSPVFRNLPLPLGCMKAVAFAVNDKGQATGYGWGSAHDFSGALWDTTGAVLLDTLGHGSFSIGTGIDNAGRVLTQLGGLVGPPVLLVPPGGIQPHRDMVGPLWEVVFGVSDGQPTVGIKGVGIIVLLPNGQEIRVPYVRAAAHRARP